MKKTVKILSIDQAVKAQLLTKQEGIEHHDWHKGEALPVDNKTLIYHGDEFVAMIDHRPSMSEVLSILSEADILI